MYNLTIHFCRNNEDGDGGNDNHNIDCNGNYSIDNNNESHNTIANGDDDDCNDSYNDNNHNYDDDESIEIFLKNDPYNIFLFYFYPCNIKIVLLLVLFFKEANSNLIKYYRI